MEDDVVFKGIVDNLFKQFGTKNKSSDEDDNTDTEPDHENRQEPE